MKRAPLFVAILIALLTAILPLTTSADITNGLVLHYDFDSDGGTNVVDQSAYGNDGFVTGSPWIADAQIGGGMDFDGVDDQINCGRDSSIDITGPMTIAAWVNPDETGGTGSKARLIAGKWYDISNTDLRQYVLEYQLDGKLILAIGDGANQDFVQSAASLETGRWTHVAGVYDGSLLKIYMDGVQVGVETTAQVMASVAVDLTIAKRAVGDFGSEYLDGKLDDIRIYNRALSASDVVELYQNGTDNLVLHYTFDADDGASVLDQSMYGNNGVVSGATWTASGQTGGAMSFDGTNDYVGVNDADDSIFDFDTNDFSVSAWVYPDMVSGYQTILMKGEDKVTNYIIMRIDDGGTVRFGAGSQAGGSAYFNGSTVLSVATWHHVVLTRNGSIHYIYIDGEFDASWSGGPYSVTSPRPFEIGRRHDAGSYIHYLDGSVDDVRAWSYALSSNEVEQLYAAVDLAELVVQGSPVAYGTSTPYGYGTNNVPISNAVTVSVGSPVDDTGSRYVCTGWVGTGSVPFSGASNSASFTITTNSSLTWSWQLQQYELIVSGSANCGISQTGGWYNAGSTQILTAIPSNGYAFVQWTGDVSGGSETNNPLSVTMDQARTIGVQVATTNTNSLVLHYTFDADDGTNVVDQSGSGNDGIIYGDPVWTNSGISGGAISFDGSGDYNGDGDYIEVSNEPTFDFERTNPFTMAAWVKFVDKNNGWDSFIVAKEYHNSPNTGYYMYTGPYGTYGHTNLHFGMQGLPFNVSMARGSTYLFDDSWHHVVSVNLGNDGSPSDIVLYVDGQLESMTTVWDSLGANTILTDLPLTIGSRQGGASPMAGLIDDVRVYNRALSSNEVWALADSDSDGLSDAWELKSWGNLDQVAGGDPDADGITNIDEYGYGTDPTVPDSLDAGLVLHYTFDSDEGTNVVDQSGNGNNGFVTGSPWIADAQTDGGMDFDGVDDQINCGRNSSIDITGPMAITAWVNPDEIGGAGSKARLIAGKWYDISGADLRQYVLEYQLDGKLVLAIGDGANQDFVQSDASLETGRWTHVAGVYDGSLLKIYMDGVQVGVETAAQVMASVAVDLTIAKRAVGDFGAEYLDGQMDDVRIYNRALSSNEVWQLADSDSDGMPDGWELKNWGNLDQVAGGDPDADGVTNIDEYGYGTDPTVPDNLDAGLVLHYDFDSDDGASVIDQSMYGNDGVVNGTTWIANGAIGGAIDLDGVDDYINSGQGSSIDLTGAVTVVAWVNIDDVGGIGSKGRLIAGKWYDISNSTTRQYALSFAYDGMPRFYISTGPSHDHVEGSSALPTGEWVHVAGAYDGDNLRIYVNGIETGSKTTALDIVSQSIDLFMGNKSYGDFGSESYDGRIDDLRIYNRALSSNEVSQLTDSDNDGLPDWWELKSWGDIDQVAGGDPDGDGFTNLQEYQNGTDPTVVDNLDVGLVLHYDFDSDDGASVIDQSIYGNDGSVSGATWTASGVMGGAMSFDGTDDFIKTADDDSLSFTDGTGNDQPFTVSAWAYFNDATGGALVCKREGSLREWGFASAGAGGPADTFQGGVYLPNSSAYKTKRTDTALMTALEGKWVHLTLSYDGSETAEGINLYIDGVEQSMTDSSVGSYAGMSNTTAALFMGFNADNQYLDGIMDDVRVYNRALSSNEVSQLVDSDADGLFDWWEIDNWGNLDQGAGDDADGDGQTNLDEYTNGNDPNADEWYLDTTAGANGSVNVGDGWYTNGAGVSVTASPSSGYHLVNWSGDVATSANPLVLTMGQAYSVTANFAINMYDITATSVSSGTIAPSGVVQVAHGSSTGFVVQASAGAHIADVLVDDSSAGVFGLASNLFNYTFSNVTSNHAISAIFNAEPVVAVIAFPRSGAAPLRVTFDLSGSTDPDTDIVRWEIDQDGDGFYDSAGDDLGSVILEYPEPGIFTSSVQVVDGYGAVSATSIVIEVSGSAPIADLQTIPSTTTAAVLLKLTGTNSTAAAGHEIVVYEFDVDGDGSYEITSTNGTLWWGYSEPGTNTAVLRVTDDQGLQSVDSEVVTVTPAPNPPTVSLSVSPENGNVPLSVVFTAVVTDDVGVGLYEWDFDGDGAYDLVTETNTATNVYTVVGSYSPSVEVFDGSGLSDSDSASVYVTEAPSLKVWISTPKTDWDVSGADVTVHANTAPGNLTGSVLMQYKKSSESNWVDIGATMYPPPNSYKTTWDASGLVNAADYDLRAVASDTSSNIVYSEVVTVQVYTAWNDEVDDVDEDNSSGQHKKKQKLDKDQTTTIDIFDDTSVTVPAGTVNSNPVVQVVLVGGNTNPVNGSAEGTINIGENRKVSIAGDPSLNKPITIKIPYDDVDNDGIVDGTGIPETVLVPYWYDTVDGEWKRALSFEINTTKNYVKLKTYHLTEFGVFGTKNILVPENGGILESFTSEYTNTMSAANLADDNKVSFWRSETNPSVSQVFVYSFTNGESAVVTEAVVHNSINNGYESEDFDIQASMDGSNYWSLTNGTLAANDGQQSFAFGSVTCRTVKLIVSSGVDPQAWELREFALHGQVTDDADGDGLEDAWETLYFSDIFAYGATSDPDNDGLNNALEESLGTKPNDEDTDGDGAKDGYEVLSLTDPLDPFDFPRSAVNDYNGDGKSDLSVFDTVGGFWYIKTTSGSVISWANQWGWSTAVPVPGDYDGDGLWDQAVFDTVGGFWYIKTTSGSVITWADQWGWTGALAVPGDYDGDGISDQAIFDTAGGFWYIKTVSGSVITWGNQWGWSTAIPVPGDYDGDGVDDLAVFDTVGGFWYIKTVSGSVISWGNQWGWTGALAVPGDYDGDGISDQAIFDTPGGNWYIKTASGSVISWANQWGWSTAVPVPGDYNGDGVDDLAVFDNNTGFWYIKSISGGLIKWADNWGWPGAFPVGKTE